jgi:hypothetical protein
VESVSWTYVGPIVSMREANAVLSQKKAAAASPVDLMVRVAAAKVVVVVNTAVDKKGEQRAPRETRDSNLATDSSMTGTLSMEMGRTAAVKMVVVATATDKGA